MLTPGKHVTPIEQIAFRWSPRKRRLRLQRDDRLKRSKTSLAREKYREAFDLPSPTT